MTRINETARPEDTGADRLNRVDEPQAEQAGFASTSPLTPHGLNEARKEVAAKQLAYDKHQAGRSYLNGLIERKERHLLRKVGDLQTLRKKVDQMLLCDIEAALTLYHELRILD